jgi:hypothetical protein
LHVFQQFLHEPAVFLKGSSRYHDRVHDPTGPAETVLNGISVRFYRVKAAE